MPEAESICDDVITTLQVDSRRGNLPHVSHVAVVTRAKYFYARGATIITFPSFYYSGRCQEEWGVKAWKFPRCWQFSVIVMTRNWKHWPVRKPYPRLTSLRFCASRSLRYAFSVSSHPEASTCILSAQKIDSQAVKWATVTPWRCFLQTGTHGVTNTLEIKKSWHAPICWS